MNKTYKYEIRQIDAICESIENNYPMWYYNETWHICTFTTSAETKTGLNRAFRKALANHGITFVSHKTAIECYPGGDTLELYDRSNRMPLFYAELKEV